MTNKKVYIYIIISIFGTLLNNTKLFAQIQNLVYNETNSRDPFIPLIDDKGNIRRDFTKPTEERLVPKVTLMGISQVGNTFYALIDGELVKEGQTLKQIRIEKITSEKVIVTYGDKQFELKWEPNKK